MEVNINNNTEDVINYLVEDFVSEEVKEINIKIINDFKNIKPNKLPEVDPSE